MKQLWKQHATEKRDFKTVAHIYIKLPLLSAHCNHIVCLESAFSNPLHPKIKSKIHQLVQDGITSVPLVKRLLKSYVISELCRYDAPENKPAFHDRSYFPNSQDITNHVHRALAAGKYSNMDQVNLEKHVHKWREENPGSFFHLRLCMDTENLSKRPSATKRTSRVLPMDVCSDDEGDEDDDECLDATNETSNSFLFIHQ